MGKRVVTGSDRHREVLQSIADCVARAAILKAEQDAREERDAMKGPRGYGSGSLRHMQGGN